MVFIDPTPVLGAATWSLFPCWSHVGSLPPTWCSPLLTCGYRWVIIVTSVAIIFGTVAPFSRPLASLEALLGVTWTFKGTLMPFWGVLGSQVCV